MVDAPPTSDLSPPSAPDWSQVTREPAQPPTSSTNQKEDSPPKGLDSHEITTQTVHDMRANRTLREVYADKAYQLATGCISFWMVLVGSQGVVNAVTGREMWSDKVIIAVTTGVTVSVLAAFLGVIRGLFPNGNGSVKK